MPSRGHVWDPFAFLKTASDSADYASKGLSLLRWLNSVISGGLLITSPRNTERKNTERVLIKGTHSRASGGRFYYWLMTHNGNNWWPQQEINLLLDGTWSGKVNVGKSPGPRTSIAAVVQVTPIIHILLTELKELRGKTETKTTSPIRLGQGNLMGWKVVAHVSIQISEGPILSDKDS